MNFQEFVFGANFRINFRGYNYDEVDDYLDKIQYYISLLEKEVDPETLMEIQSKIMLATSEQCQKRLSMSCDQKTSKKLAVNCG
jgi:DivIVA domain-containing protein